MPSALRYTIKSPLETTEWQGSQSMLFYTPHINGTQEIQNKVKLTQILTLYHMKLHYN